MQNAPPDAIATTLAFRMPGVGIARVP